MAYAKLFRVTRTSYDRFEDENGEVGTSGDLTRLRLDGWAVHITDATPAECGEWICEPLERD